MKDKTSKTPKDTPTQKQKGILENTELSDMDDVRIGDTKASKDENEYDQKNIVKDSTIKNVRNFRLGDDY